MKTTLHKAGTRIVNDLGWLRISASFREEAEADRRNFGKLLILDDALMIPGGRGFALHPHDNMEIISWILSGVDEHNDSVRGISLIGSDEVQLMSAGSGIEHAENNSSRHEAVHMFQIWIEAKERNIAPNYQKKTLRDIDRTNKLVTFISPTGESDSLTINQDAYLTVTRLSEQQAITYPLRRAGHGVYVFVLLGNVHVAGHALGSRDAVGIEGVNAVDVVSERMAEILFIEVPMA